MSRSVAAFVRAVREVSPVGLGMVDITALGLPLV